jgi:hypothetical protein
MLRLLLHSLSEKVSVTDRIKSGNLCFGLMLP